MELQLTGKHGETEGKIIQIIGVKNVWHYGSGGCIEPLFDDKNGKWRFVLLQDGLLVCVDDVDEFVDLEGGSLAPGFTSYGSSLGPEEILYEPFTNDGDVYDPLVDGNLPSVLGKDTAIIRAVDGLQFNGRNTL